MPLLTPIERINAALAADAGACEQYLRNAIAVANRMVETLLALGDAELTAWLNSESAAEIQARFAAHEQLGTFLNGAVAIAAEWAGAKHQPPFVNISSVAQKLAGQRRVLAFADGLFSVTTLPLPEPEPQPEIPAEPEPEPKL
jgi:hypothetical protein